MKKLALVTLLAAAFPALAQDTSSTNYVENVEQYGNCVVANRIDMFTDQVTYLLTCQETSLTDKTQIVFGVFPDGQYGVFLSKGIQFHLEEQIEFALRVDRNELRYGVWDWNSTGYSAYLLNDSETFQGLLTEMSNGERLVVKVGAEDGNILLRGAYDAIVDFLARTEGRLPRFIIPN